MKKRTTEKPSYYNHLEKMTTVELVESINREDASVALSVEKCTDDIVSLCNAVYERLNDEGRLFYIGSGTSGRLGIVDASECPPTFGVPHGMVVGLIAGGDSAIRKAVEMAEDDTEQGWKDLLKHNITSKDFVIGLSASGTTPYVLGALKACRENNIGTGCVVCNENSPIASESDFPVEVIVGPEFVTGSTRMKSGTAQKMVLNMVTTSSMIKLGHVHGNKMIDMQLSNEKLVIRGTEMIMDYTGLPYEVSKDLLLEHGSVRKAISNWKK
jgi:N-acetylmuramic acid 6-phosphate etherase